MRPRARTLAGTAGHDRPPEPARLRPLLAALALLCACGGTTHYEPDGGDAHALEPEPEAGAPEAAAADAGPEAQAELCCVVDQNVTPCGDAGAYCPPGGVNPAHATNTCSDAFGTGETRACE